MQMVNGIVEPLKVGDKLWRVSSRHRDQDAGTEVEIVKVGRKWAMLAGWTAERVSLETLTVDGGDYSSPAQCYRSRADYEAKTALLTAWDNFACRVARSCVPPGATLEWIATAHRELGIPTSEVA